MILGGKAKKHSQNRNFPIFTDIFRKIPIFSENMKFEGKLFRRFNDRTQAYLLKKIIEIEDVPVGPYA